jgi:hypothetical protein
VALRGRRSSPSGPGGRPNNLNRRLMSGVYDGFVMPLRLSQCHLSVTCHEQVTGSLSPYSVAT